MGINIGSLIRASVSAVGGGLQGQNEGDELLYKHRQDEKAEQLRRYVAERQMKAEDRAAQNERDMADHRRREGQHWTAMERPEWQRLGYPSFEAWDADTHEPAAHNIDPLSGPGQDARVSLETKLAGIPRRRSPAQEHDDTATALKAVSAQVDDTRSDLGRAEREVPPAYETLPIPPPDSAAYTRSRQGAVDRVTNLQQRADSLGGVRDSLAGEFMVPGSGRPARKRPPPPPTGPRPDRPLGHAASQPEPPMPVVAPEGPAAAGAGAGANPELSGKLHKLQEELRAGMAWRGPNGERKDPVALQQAYLEQLAKVQAGQ